MLKFAVTNTMQKRFIETHDQNLNWRKSSENRVGFIRNKICRLKNKNRLVPSTCEPINITGRKWLHCYRENCGCNCSSDRTDTCLVDQEGFLNNKTEIANIVLFV